MVPKNVQVAKEELEQILLPPTHISLDDIDGLTTSLTSFHHSNSLYITIKAVADPGTTVTIS